MPASERFQELVFQLGDVAYERLWNRPDAPRGVARVIKAAEAYEQRQIDLRDVEQAMRDEENAYAEFQQACADESAECEELVKVHKKAVDAAESKAKSIAAKMISKLKDVESGKLGLQKYEENIRRWEELGEAAKAQAGREGVKKAKLDLMKRQREHEEMQAEYDALMNPESGPASDAIRARQRQLDLDQQLQERTDAYNQLIQELTDQAAALEQQVAAAKDYFDQALALFGEEVWRARVDDPALTPFYPKLDKLSR